MRNTMVNLSDGFGLPATIAAAAAGIAVLDKEAVILGTNSHLLVCVVGAMLGGILAVSMGPKTTQRKSGINWISSTVFSLVFSPIVATIIAAKWMNGEMGNEYLLALSGAMAFFAFTIMHGLQLIVSKRVDAFVRKSTKPDDGQKEEK